MGFRIGPRLRAAFVVGVPKQPSGWIVEVLVINQHLLCRLVVCVPAVPKHLAIAREEWQRHKNAVGPELPLATLRVRMPERAVLRARVSVEDFANTFRRELVFLLLRFLVENQQKISRHHEIQGVDGAIDLALVVDMQIDPRLDMIQSWIDLHIDDQGKINRPINALDFMMPGNLLLILYQETKQEKYKLAAESIRKVFDTYPRTKDGAFWHANTQSRQWQLWADGVFMSLPFLARYGQMFGDSRYANDEATKQMRIYYKHLNDPVTGLLWHAYDESR